MNSLTFGQFIPGDSLFHRLDPRTKIFVSLMLITLVILLDRIDHLIGFGLFLGLLIYVSGISLRMFLRSIRLIMFLVLFTLLIHFFFTPGTPLFEWGFVKVSKTGLYQGLLISQKLLYIISVTSLITLTTSPMSLIDGLQHILSPLKKIGVPGEELAMMMGIALRFIPTLWEETDKIKKAQMSRGALFDSGKITKRISNITSLVVPILVSAFRRADELALAMESRAYQVGITRTRMKVMKFTGQDYMVMILTGCITLIVAVLRFLW